MHITDLGHEHRGQHRANAGDGLDGPVPGVVAKQLAHLALDYLRLTVDPRADAPAGASAFGPSSGERVQP